MIPSVRHVRDDWNTQKETALMFSALRMKENNKTQMFMWSLKATSSVLSHRCCTHVQMFSCLPSLWTVQPLIFTRWHNFTEEFNLIRLHQNFHRHAQRMLWQSADVHSRAVTLMIHITTIWSSARLHTCLQITPRIIITSYQLQYSASNELRIRPNQNMQNKSWTQYVNAVK
jgi:hypothetical protein